MLPRLHAKSASRGVLAIAFALVAMAVGPAAAQAATDRADYAAQVNPICAAANAQSKAIYESAEQAVERLSRRAKKHRGKKNDRLFQQLSKVFFDAGDQSLAVARAALAQVRVVLPAPGDESIVSEWLATDQALLDMSAESNALSRRIDRLFTAEITFHSFRALERHERKLKRLEQQANTLYAQIEPLAERYTELGAKLGATYCVSDATGGP